MVPAGERVRACVLAADSRLDPVPPGRLPFLAAVLHGQLLADVRVDLADGSCMVLWGDLLAAMSPCFARALAGTSAAGSPDGAVTRSIDLAAHDTWSVRVLVHEAVFPHAPRAVAHWRGAVTLAAYCRLHATAAALRLPIPGHVRLDLDSVCSLHGIGDSTTLRIVSVPRDRARGGSGESDEYNDCEDDDYDHGEASAQSVAVASRAACARAVADLLGDTSVVRSVAPARASRNPTTGLFVNGSPRHCRSFEAAVRHAVDCDAARAQSPRSAPPGDDWRLRTSIPFRMWYGGLLGDALVLLRSPAADELGPCAPCSGWPAGEFGMRLPSAFVRYASAALSARLRPIGDGRSEAGGDGGFGWDALADVAHMPVVHPGVIPSRDRATTVGPAAWVVDCRDADGAATCFLLAHALCGDGAFALGASYDVRPDPGAVLRLDTAFACRVAHASRALGIPSSPRYRAGCLVAARFSLYPHVGYVAIRDPGDGDPRVVRLSPVLPAFVGGRDGDTDLRRPEPAPDLKGFDFFADASALRQINRPMGCGAVRRLRVGIEMSCPGVGVTWRSGQADAMDGEGPALDGCKLEDVLAGAPLAELLNVVVNDTVAQYDLGESSGRSREIDIGEAIEAAVVAWCPSTQAPADPALAPAATPTGTDRKEGQGIGAGGNDS